MEEMGSKVASLEASLAESREKTAAAPSGQGLHSVWWSLNSFSLDKNDVTEGGGDDVHDDDGDNDGDDDGDAGERDKYKALARRLKEERNQYKEMLENKSTEQAELQVVVVVVMVKDLQGKALIIMFVILKKIIFFLSKVEMDKMTEMIGELRENCNALQKDLLSARQDDVRLVLNVLLPSMYHHHHPSSFCKRSLSSGQDDFSFLTPPPPHQETKCERPDRANWDQRDPTCEEGKPHWVVAES